MNRVKCIFDSDSDDDSDNGKDNSNNNSDDDSDDDSDDGNDDTFSNSDSDVYSSDEPLFSDDDSSDDEVDLRRKLLLKSSKPSAASASSRNKRISPTVTLLPGHGSNTSRLTRLKLVKALAEKFGVSKCQHMATDLKREAELDISTIKGEEESSMYHMLKGWPIIIAHLRKESKELEKNSETKSKSTIARTTFKSKQSPTLTSLHSA